MKKVLIPAASAALFSAAFATFSDAATIQDIYNQGAGTYALTATVSSILDNTQLSNTTNTFTLTDSTGSLLAYRITKTNYTATPGDTVSFTAIVNSPFNATPELTNTGLTPASISSTSGLAPAPAVISVPQFNSAASATGGVTPYAEAYVQINNVAFSTPVTTLANATTYTLTDQSSNTFILYSPSSDSSTTAAIAAANTAETASGNTLFAGLLNLTGFVDIFRSGTSPSFVYTSEFYPYSISAASASTPEPASACLIGVGSLTLLLRRRRRESFNRSGQQRLL